MVAVVAFDLYKDKVWLESVKRQNLESIENKVQQVFNKSIAKHRGKDRTEQITFFKQELDDLILKDNQRLTIYDLQGNIVFGEEEKSLEPLFLEKIKSNKGVFIQREEGEIIVYHSYNYLFLGKENFGVVNVSEQIDKTSILMNFRLMMKQYFFAMVIMFVLSGYVAWFISRMLMERVDVLAKQLPKTNIEYLDTPIVEYKEKDEISPLIESYNHMLQKLKRQTEQLAQIEREESWRETTRQIVHEVRNPLTPLKLMVQNFQRKYNPEDENNIEKVRKLTESVIHQVDVIYAVTESFSESSKSPLGSGMIDVVKILKYSLEIFPEKIVEFHTNEKELFYKIDETYLTRVVTNIVKNGIQSIPHQDKKIKVHLVDEPQQFRISIQDNGAGISKENQEKIFESKFTTKSTGMGIGLAIVKKIVEDYHGRIWFETEEGKGTTFHIEFYK